MPVDQMAAATDATPRTNPRFRPHKIVPPIAGLLAIAAFLLFGPIGLGNGPLGVPAMDGRIGLSTTQPSAYVGTLVNTGGSTAVIDNVTATPADGYAPARVLSVRVAGRSSYGCVFTAMGSLSQCARPPFAAAAGFAVRPHANTVPGNRAGPALVVEIAAPPAAACVALTAIVVHYHVGIRHYTATDPQGVVWACGPDAQQPHS